MKCGVRSSVKCGARSSVECEEWSVDIGLVWSVKSIKLPSEYELSFSGSLYKFLVNLM